VRSRRTCSDTKTLSVIGVVVTTGSIITLAPIPTIYFTPTVLKSNVLVTGGFLTSKIIQHLDAQQQRANDVNNLIVCL